MIKILLTPLAILSLLIAGIFLLLSLLLKSKSLFIVAVSFDQNASAIWYKKEDITVSGMIGYKIRNNKANAIERFICKVLRKIEIDHCINAIEEDEV